MSCWPPGWNPRQLSRYSAPGLAPVGDGWTENNALRAARHFETERQAPGPGATGWASRFISSGKSSGRGFIARLVATRGKSKLSAGVAAKCRLGGLNALLGPSLFVPESNPGPAPVLLDELYACCLERCADRLKGALLRIGVPKLETRQGARGNVARGSQLVA